MLGLEKEPEAPSVWAAGHRNREEDGGGRRWGRRPLRPAERRTQCFELARGSETLSLASPPELTPVADATSAVLAQTRLPGRDSSANTRAGKE